MASDTKNDALERYYTALEYILHDAQDLKGATDCAHKALYPPKLKPTRPETPDGD